MRDFDFVSPKSLQEALAILRQLDGRVLKPLAGGTDLIDQLRSGRRTADIVMDTKHIPEMLVLEFDPHNGLRIGAAVNCSTIASYAPVRERYHAIAESCGLVGSVQIQNRAGIGGNVCNAAPSADTVPSLLVHEAIAVIIGPNGQRELPLDQFFVGPGQSVLAPNEVLLEIRVPVPPANSASHYLRFIPREEMDIAVAGAASFLELEPGSNRCRRARIALAAVAPTPIRAPEAEALLQGKELTPDVLVQAAEAAARAARPISDVRGSAAYRIELVKVLTRRTLEACLHTLGVRR